MTNWGLVQLGDQILLALDEIGNILNNLPGIIQVIIWLPWGAFILGAIFKEILKNGRGG